MVLVLFGVTGTGKSVVGQRLAAELGWSFYDADAFHSAANIDKLRAGVPLTDADRRPWLDAVRQQIVRCIDRAEHAVVACSALKRSYRSHLTVTDDVRFVYLKGDYEVLEQRLEDRTGHFMNPQLLRSQLDTLEDPEADAALVVDACQTPETLVREIRTVLAV